MNEMKQANKKDQDVYKQFDGENIFSLQHRNWE